jgi:hypothetical protein
VTRLETQPPLLLPLVLPLLGLFFSWFEVVEVVLVVM